jgi:hydrogenase expression/formation protein HypE
MWFRHYSFPGGDIGCLSVHGTINDVAMTGARPLYLAATFILEEGFPLADLQKIVESMARAAKQASVPIVTGDTKVVERGKGDGVFITTTSIGVIPDDVDISAHRAQPGDVLLLSGALGDHGLAVLAQRENLRFDAPIESDTAALHTLVAAMVAAVPGLHCLRDLTRGGLGSAVNEIAHQSRVGMRLREAAIPVHEPVRALCEFLGAGPALRRQRGQVAGHLPSSVR